MLFRFRKDRAATPPASEPGPALGAEPAPPAAPPDWEPAREGEAEAELEGVSLDRSRPSYRGKALESARGSHR
jgi:hypothetical protein